MILSFLCLRFSHGNAGPHRSSIQPVPCTVPSTGHHQHPPAFVRMRLHASAGGWRASKRAWRPSRWQLRCARGARVGLVCMRHA